MTERYYMIARLLGVIAILMSFLGLVVFSLGVILASISYSTKSWHTANALIMESKLVEVKTKTGFTYKPVVKYKYTADGKEYTGDSVRFIDFNYWSHSKALKVVEKFPVGKELESRYHKDHPKMTVLEPGAHASDLWIPLAGIAFFVGALVLRHARRRLLRQQA